MDEFEDYSIRGDSVFGALCEGNVIALYTPQQEIEPFYLCIVDSFGTATTALKDNRNHMVTVEKNMFHAGIYRNFLLN